MDRVDRLKKELLAIEHKIKKCQLQRKKNLIKLIVEEMFIFGTIVIIFSLLKLDNYPLAIAIPIGIAIAAAIIMLAAVVVTYGSEFVNENRMLSDNIDRLAQQAKELQQAIDDDY